MKELKKGNLLWDAIEKVAREKHNVDARFELTMVNLGHPLERILGECEYRINDTTSNDFYQGFIKFDPYVNA